jgi:hypothetical protein
MDLDVCLKELVFRYWMKRTGDEATPTDLWLAALITKFGVGGFEPNHRDAVLWFGLARTAHEHARYRAALGSPPERKTETIDLSEYFEYDKRVFDETLRRHLYATVHSGADELQLGLSAMQKDALARYVIDTFKRLLSPPADFAADILRLPETPPERYAARKVNEDGQRENVVDFLNRVYAKEIMAGIIADSDLSSLDRPAYHALHSWNTNHPNDPFHLVKKPEVIERENSERLETLRQMALQHPDQGPQVTRERLRQVRRLEGALRRSLLP